MHVLINECLPKKLKHELSEHTVFTVQEKGWSGIKNGELLHKAESEFDVWVTGDKNIEYQQNLDRFDIAVVVLVASRNRLDVLLPLMPQLHKALQTIQPRQIVYIGSYSKARKYVDIAQTKLSLCRWRGFAAYSTQCDLHS